MMVMLVMMVMMVLMIMMVMMENNIAGAANQLGLARMLTLARLHNDRGVKPFQMSPHLFAIINFDLKVILLLHDCIPHI